MNALSHRQNFAIGDFLRQQEEKSLLRFIACGSVDHGKSSLLGRLLYEASPLHDDQLAALQTDTQRHGGAAGELDYSLLLDGLSAEREQKITIDVAYRFFATAKRKFIVIDAPGHEQYTRNMATGASNADLALILIDAKSGFTAQTRRHSLLVSMLGVRRIIVAVNKMDLTGWSEEKFAAIEREFRAFARTFETDSIEVIPVSARGGDNVVRRSANMPWYSGPTLLEHLEAVPVASAQRDGALRMPIQWVNRPDANFRGYSGTIASGTIRAGQRIRLLPSGQTAEVARLVTADGDLAQAGAGQAITVTLTTEVDGSRGDVIADDTWLPAISNRAEARIFWMAPDALTPSRHLLARLGTSLTTARVARDLKVVDINTLATSPAAALSPNEIGQCIIEFDRPLAIERYGDNRELGSLILIDPETNNTVGMGFVTAVATAAPRQASVAQRAVAFAQSLYARRANFGLAGETHARSIAKAVSWRAAASLGTFVLALLITGSTVFAASLVLAEIIAKLCFYYLHERAWLFVRWGRG